MFQNPKNETFRKSYIESLTNIIDQKNSEIVTFSIRLHQNFINKIQDIQKGSEISKTIIQTFGPYTLYKKLWKGFILFGWKRSIQEDMQL